MGVPTRGFDREPLPGDVRIFHDTCNVYVIPCGSEAVLVDFGKGDVLDHLGEVGVERVSDVVVTHHHRDQVEGLARARRAGIRIWVPPVERGLFEDVDRLWQERDIDNYYDLRQDRFSLLGSVQVTGTAAEYRTRRYGGVELACLPTPGHTVGSVTYLANLGGRRLAFSGDLIYGRGKLWSLAATQWSYSGVEGLVATMSSCNELEAARPDLILPSHGAPVTDPSPALQLVQERLQRLVENWRDEHWEVRAWYRQPWVEITPHLLRNHATIATSYALLSESGTALLFDYGYDMCGGILQQSDRAAKRPLLASVRALKEQHGVERVEVAVPTHYHDDHVAAFNLLSEVEGTEIWAASNVAPVLEDPANYDLPCLWYEPIPVRRHVETGRPLRWREYELAMYPLPGHTLYAVAIDFEVDGRRVLATGDQQTGQWRNELLNYQYKNRFRIDDFVASAELYQRLRPDIMVSGHWRPRLVDDFYLATLHDAARSLAQLHRDVLPLEDVDFGAEGFGARIEPYRSSLEVGQQGRFSVSVKNPFNETSEASVELVVPAGWLVEPVAQRVELAAHGEGVVEFKVLPVGGPVRRARVAADMTVGGVAFGQQAEALVSVG
jgi:glyoxylase-like metal-dependent hydrolase (beta-lactamase superfamily II)